MEKKEIELSYRVQRLEEQSKTLMDKEVESEKVLIEIREGLVAIKEALVSNKEQTGLKNQIMLKDLEATKDRVGKLEANQRWLVISVFGEVLGIIFGIIMIFIQHSMGI